MENNKLVKSISEIKNRRRHYIDILDKRVDGQNIYYLVGHTRSNIFSFNSGIGGIKNAKGEYASKIIQMPEKSAVRLRTIPNSNLNERKREVLRIHKQNMDMVTRLASTKPTSEMQPKPPARN